jgi:hypothetical protein
MQASSIAPTRSTCTNTRMFKKSEGRQAPRTGGTVAATRWEFRLLNALALLGESVLGDRVSRPAIGGPTKWGARSRAERPLSLLVKSFELFTNRRIE